MDGSEKTNLTDVGGRDATIFAVILRNMQKSEHFRRKTYHTYLSPASYAFEFICAEFGVEMTFES